MLAGGHDGFHIMSSVELYSPNGTCQHNLAPLPSPTYGLVLSYVETLVMHDDLSRLGCKLAVNYISIFRTL